MPPAYADGVYEPSGQDRPNPIELSQSLMGGPTGLPSVRNRTAFLVFFGESNMWCSDEGLKMMEEGDRK